MELPIQQKTSSDCVLASIAMALDKPYDEVWSSEDTKWTVDNRGIADKDPWLKKAGITRYKEVHFLYHMEQGYVHSLLWGRRALLSVHSLNIPGGYHMVYWDGQNLWDPSRQRTYAHLHSCIVSGAVLL